MKTSEKNEQMKLLFGPFIRVSTEPQKIRGESLKIQRTQQEEAMKALEGEPVDWYGGSEHATPGQERKELTRLIEDVLKRRINAIIVADASRWSRDNKKSKQYIEMLQEKDARFFILRREIDLSNPDDLVNLGIQVELGEYWAKALARKSILGKIEKAEKGIPPTGKRPYGRTYDRKTGEWAVDAEAKKRIQEIARLYLTTKTSFNELGKRFGMNGAYLHRVLLRNSGDKWPLNFHSKRFKIDRRIELSIPPLLPADIIRRIGVKAEGKRLWDRGKMKHEYILSRIIFDGPTRRALTGTTMGTSRYYRRFNGEGRYSISADRIERAVMAEIFSLIQDDQALHRAIYEDSSRSKMAEQLAEQKSLYEKELKSLLRKQEVLVDNLTRISGKDNPKFIEGIERKAQAIEERMKQLTAEVKGIENKLASIPSAADVKRTQAAIRDMTKKWFEDTVWMKGRLKQRIKESYAKNIAIVETFWAMPFEEKKKFLNLMLGGRDEESQRLGVYVFIKGKGNRKKIRFEIRGKIGEREGWVQEAGGILRDSFDHSDHKLSIRDECHAYHGFRFYQR